MRGGLTCFLLNLTEDREQGRLHSMAVQGVFPGERENRVRNRQRRIFRRGNLAAVQNVHSVSKNNVNRIRA